MLTPDGTSVPASPVADDTQFHFSPRPWRLGRLIERNHVIAQPFETGFGHDPALDSPPASDEPHCRRRMAAAHELLRDGNRRIGLMTFEHEIDRLARLLQRRVVQPALREHWRRTKRSGSFDVRNERADFHQAC